MAQLLITGGAGFIGSHTCLVLLEAGHQLVVLDNFSNSSPEALRRVCELAGQAPLLPVAPGRWCSGEGAPSLTLIEGDLRDHAALEQAFLAQHGPIEAVIHFAGLKAVGESVAEPLRYWDVNLHGSRCLLQAMADHGCRTLVFSSSATLYGFPEAVPIPESAPIRPINPYGHTKAAVEQLLADLAASSGADQPGWRIARLRYFNPVGAHPSGRIGEDPNGIPNNLFPFVSQVAVGRRERLQVFGSDWPTPDGTGIRDYIHVMDLAEGHLAALDVLLREAPQLLSLNLGSGQGHSVLEVVRAFEQASGRPVPYELVPRRAGDAAITVADASLAAERLGWRTQRSLEEICRDGWQWQRANPKGYSE
ncbi:MAG: UDP-glucose 4-epimerase GalE [Prochlorococcaceae cyanobacterium]